MPHKHKIPEVSRNIEQYPERDFESRVLKPLIQKWPEAKEKVLTKEQIQLIAGKFAKFYSENPHLIDKDIDYEEYFLNYIDEQLGRKLSEKEKNEIIVTMVKINL